MEKRAGRLMRVFLLSANTEQEPYPTYPLGLSVIAAATQKAGHDAEQHDLLYLTHVKNSSLVERLRQSNPDVVGISLRNIDNVDSFTSEAHWHLDRFRQLIKDIRQTTPAPIVIGGAGFSLMPEAILDYCGGDYGIVGEGEQAFSHLLELLEQKKTPPRIMKAPFLCTHAEIQEPCFAPDLLRYYTEASGVISLHTKRGCVKNCLYCTYPLLEGRTIRPRPVEAVLDDLRWLKKNAKFQELFFTDAVFNDISGHWLRLVEGMARAGISTPWTAFFQPEGLTGEALALCKRTGLKAVEFGTDALSDTTLSALDKGFSFDAARQATSLCHNLALPCAHFVICGGPGETMHTLHEGLDNLETLEQCLVFAFLGIRIYQGTPLMDQAIREGIAHAEDSTLRPTYYFTPHITPGDAADVLRQRFRKNRLRIFPPSAGQERIRALQALGFRGILWDKLLRFPQARSASRSE